MHTVCQWPYALLVIPVYQLLVIPVYQEGPCMHTVCQYSIYGFKALQYGKKGLVFRKALVYGLVSNIAKKGPCRAL